MSYKNMTDKTGDSGFLPTVIFAGTGILTSAMRITQLATEGITGYYEADFADGITQLADGCFENDTSLVVASINKVSSIGSRAFNKCSNLRAITLDTALDASGVYLLNNIGQQAFQECTSLRNVYIPDSISGRIGYSWFDNCTSLEVCVIGNGYNEIELFYNMFSNCISLKYIVIPENVTVIYNDVFQNCSSLATVVFNGKPILQSQAFSSVVGSGTTYIHDVSWLTTYISYLPASATKIAYTTITFTPTANNTLTPGDVNTIYNTNKSQNPYLNSNKYYKAVISSSTTKIDKYAFRPYETQNDVSLFLVCISIPTSVNTIGAAVFSGWYNPGFFETRLYSVYFPRSITNFVLEGSSTNSQLFNIGTEDARNASTHLQIVFPSGMNFTSTNSSDTFQNVFGDLAIQFHAGYAIILPPTLVEIKINGLAYCINVQLCNLFQKNAKSNLNILGNGASFRLGASITNKYIYVPRSLGILRDTSSLREMGTTTKLHMYSHVGGTTFTFESGGYIYTSDDLWNYIIQANYFLSSGTLYIIASLFSASTLGGDDPQRGTGLTGQPAYSGSHMIHVRDVFVISDGAFLNCGNYKSMAFDHYGGTNLILGNNAFNGASNIKNVYLNGRLLDMGQSAFDGCSSLETMILPDCLTRIPYYAFNDCNNIVSFSIGVNSSIKTIEESSMAGCWKLTNIHIPTSVISIGHAAFTSNTTVIANISNNRNITFGGGSRLSSLSSYAFGSIDNFFGYAKATKFILPNNVSWMDINVFRNTLAVYDIFIIPSKTDYIPHAMFYQSGSTGYALTKLYFPISITAVPGPRKRRNNADNGMDTNCFPKPQSACTAFMPSHMSSLFNDTDNRFNFQQPNFSSSFAYTASYYKTETLPNFDSRIYLATTVSNTTDPANTTQRHIEYSSGRFGPGPTTIDGFGINGGNKSNLLSINIPNTATMINSSAFSGCSQ
jgi:hypothetical protein